MKQQLIVHIPHSAVTMPDLEGFIVENDIIKQEQKLLTDWFTHELFNFKNAIVLVAPFSRVYCDVERFTDDGLEPMAKLGMGVVYEKTDSGTPMRKVTPALKHRIINNYYKPHHQQFSLAVQQQLNTFGKALILDGHSFPNQPLNRDLHKGTPRPVFNIGIDHFHTPHSLLLALLNALAKHGYTDEQVGINWPYSGSIVPSEFYLKNKNVYSIMLEINRSAYMNENTIEFNKNSSEISTILESVNNELQNWLNHNLGMQ